MAARAAARASAAAAEAAALKEQSISEPRHSPRPTIDVNVTHWQRRRIRIPGGSSSSSNGAIGRSIDRTPAKMIQRHRLSYCSVRCKKNIQHTTCEASARAFGHIDRRLLLFHDNPRSFGFFPWPPVPLSSFFFLSLFLHISTDERSAGNSPLCPCFLIIHTYQKTFSCSYM